MIHDIIASLTFLLISASADSFGYAGFDVDSAIEDVFARNEAGKVLVVMVGGVVSEFGGEDYSGLHVVMVLGHGAVCVDLDFADAHLCGDFGFRLCVAGNGEFDCAFVSVPSRTSSGSMCFGCVRDFGFGKDRLFAVAKSSGRINFDVLVTAVIVQSVPFE